MEEDTSSSSVNSCFDRLRSRSEYLSYNVGDRLQFSLLSFDSLALVCRSDVYSNANICRYLSCVNNEKSLSPLEEKKMWTFQKIKYEKLSDTNYRNIQIIKLVFLSCNFWGRVKSRWIYGFREIFDSLEFKFLFDRWLQKVFFSGCGGEFHFVNWNRNELID